MSNNKQGLPVQRKKETQLSLASVIQCIHNNIKLLEELDTILRAKHLKNTEIKQSI